MACVPVQDLRAKDDYHFLFVEANPDAEHDSKASPVLFKSAILTNPPQGLSIDYVAPRQGENCWEFRQDPAAVQPNFHVIVSTGSGTGLAAEVWKQLVKPGLEHIKVDEAKHYALHYTDSESTVSELTRDILLPQANLGVYQSVLLMSGDGGIVDIVNTLLSGNRSQNYRKPNIAIMPLGTGNALAHSAGITKDDTFGVKTWLRGGLQELPLFCARFSSGARLLTDEARKETPLHTMDGATVAHGAVVCSWGLHAGLVADSDTVEFRKFGVDRFKMAAQEALFPSDGSPPHVYRGKVSILRPREQNWQTIRHGEHAYVLATLCSQLEKGFTISPDTKPLDGKLRLVHFGPTTGEQAMSIMSKAYQGGQHVQDENVGYEEIEALRIDFDEVDARWRRVCIDGKIIRVEQGGWVEVRSGQKGVIDLIV
ncbi:diacylglycerol kinase [Pseudocercospora fijiensis CIRAD86]|uniref:Diacylglycerol kinase n=1 Tax=Pseudocercospora fijiensis (strain CIRAD86) TaxID=383855 RepID=N1Q762_PSEFD|nr:diacylglycerol kinase [Pseudocercospora fijiensis CIRAD86]EME88440.1 diacylglycerol kinase [Pseudocercospora fijiensis CIRAD86]